MRRRQRRVGTSRPSFKGGNAAHTAAYLGVEEAAPDRAEAFMLEMLRSRFSRSLDVALPEVIADAATRAGVSAATANEAAESSVLKDRVTANFTSGQERDGIFGAPSFVYRDELFWGHDRMHHLRRALIDGAAG